MPDLKDIIPDHEYPRIDELLYAYVCERDSGLCQCCGRAGDHLHHIVFRSHGGTNCPNNLVLLCYQCHDKVHRYEMAGNGEMPFAEQITGRIQHNEERLRRRLK